MVKVHSIIREVLSYHLELLHSLRNEPFHLSLQILDRTRLMTTRNNRNSTIRTETVTAFRNLQIGVMGRGGKSSLQRQLRVITLTQVCQDLLPIELTIVTVNLRNFCRQLLYITTRKAPHHQQTFNLMLASQLSELKNRIDGFLFRIANKTTSIDNDNATLRILRIVHHLITLSLQLTAQHLRINQIFGTSKVYYIYCIFLHLLEKMTGSIFDKKGLYRKKDPLKGSFVFLLFKERIYKLSFSEDL